MTSDAIYHLDSCYPATPSVWIKELRAVATLRIGTAQTSIFLPMAVAFYSNTLMDLNTTRSTLRITCSA